MEKATFRISAQALWADYLIQFICVGAAKEKILGVRLPSHTGPCWELAVCTVAVPSLACGPHPSDMTPFLSTPGLCSESCGFTSVHTGIFASVYTVWCSVATEVVGNGKVIVWLCVCACVCEPLSCFSLSTGAQHRQLADNQRRAAA